MLTGVGETARFLILIVWLLILAVSLRNGAMVSLGGLGRLCRLYWLGWNVGKGVRV